jgi:tubulin-folding cofactor B
MSFQPTPVDVSVIISTASSGYGTDNGPSLAPERRITPSWTVSLLKGKLETTTGIPPGSQKLYLKAPGKQGQWIEGDDRLVGEWGLTKGCEIEVCYVSHLPLYFGLLPNHADVAATLIVSSYHSSLRQIIL